MQNKRYGLRVTRPHLLPPVLAEIGRLRVWRCTAVNPNRQVPVDPIEEDTFNGNDVPRILGYLGFVAVHILGGGQPSVVMYAKEDFFMRFVSFLVERGASSAYVRSHITTGMFVLHFLRQTLASEEEKDKVESIIQGMKNLHRQIMWVAAAPRVKDITAMEAMNMWATYEELLRAALTMFQ